MQKKKKKAGHQKLERTGFDSATLFFTLFAAVLISIGTYMNLQNESATGMSRPGKYGQGGGTILNISGLFVVAVGIFFAAVPILDLIRYLRSRK